MLWDITVWEDEPPHHRTGWLLPKCPTGLDDEKNQLIDHLSGIEAMEKGRRDRRGWGGCSRKYTTTEGAKM